MLGVLPCLAVTIFIGVGSIVAGNAGNLPNQKLPLSQDGCYLINSTHSTLSPSSFYTDPSIMKTSSPSWKDLEYSGLNNFLAVSYLWHPLITVVTTVLFGLAFSLIINQFQKSKPVKIKYLTPIVLTFWVWVLGKKKLEGWVDFSKQIHISVVPSIRGNTEKLDGFAGSEYKNGGTYGSLESLSKDEKEL
jgi:hypothetical protein